MDTATATEMNLESIFIERSNNVSMTDEIEKLELRTENIVLKNRLKVMEIYMTQISETLLETGRIDKRMFKLLLENYTVHTLNDKLRINYLIDMALSNIDRDLSNREDDKDALKNIENALKNIDKHGTISFV